MLLADQTTREIALYAEKALDEPAGPKRLHEQRLTAVYGNEPYRWEGYVTDVLVWLAS